MAGVKTPVTGPEYRCSVRRSRWRFRTQPSAERHGFERIGTGQLVDTYARSKFEDTRQKAQKFGARGTTLKAYKLVAP